MSDSVVTYEWSTDSENEAEESLGAQPFMFEPEASDSSSSDSDDEINDPESRLGNTTWSALA